MRVTLIVNPHSGRGAAARCAGTVASTLRVAVPGLVATMTADAAGTSRLAAQVATVRIDGEPGWPVYADGEPQGTLPVTMHCEPGVLTVVA